MEENCPLPVKFYQWVETYFVNQKTGFEFEAGSKGRVNARVCQVLAVLVNHRVVQLFLASTH